MAELDEQREGGREAGRAGGRRKNVLEAVDCSSPLSSGETPGMGSGPGCSLDADKAEGVTRAKVGVGERGTRCSRGAWGADGLG